MALASLAGVAAVSAYLDAKYHIRKDIDALRSLREGTQQIKTAEAANRLSLWYPFEAQCKRFAKDELCIWSRQRSYTWHEIYSLSCRYATFLRNDLGVEPGDMVALDCQNSPEFMLSWLGLWAVGSAPAMINYNLESESLVHCLRVSGAKVVLLDDDEAVRGRMEAVRDKVEGELGMRIVVLNPETLARIDASEDERPPDELRSWLKATDPMMLVYTSGTTGLPKAVRYPVSRLWATIGPKVKRMGIMPGPGPGTGRWYQPMPLYHGTGGTTACMCLCSGIALCIGRKFSVSSFWDDIRDSGSTAFVYVGETARYLLAQPESPRDKDHQCTMMFGNGLRPDVWKKFIDRFGIKVVVEFFNSSEGVFGLVNICKGDFFATSVGHHGLLLRTMLKNTYVPVAVDHTTNEILRSHPPLNTTQSLEDPQTQQLGFATRVPYTTGGEILVRMPTASTAPAATGFMGYHKDPKSTTKRFATSVFRPGDLYFRSGDALRRDDDGRWYFLDRLGDTYRWKSENVSTAEVAHAVGMFPGVVEANVYGVLVPGYEGRAGCAAIYPDSSKAPLDFTALHKHLKQALPRYAVPVFLRIQGAVKAMHNQKQNKVPLRNEGVEPAKVNAGQDSQDILLWCPPGRNGYTHFGQEEWDAIAKGRARL